MDDFDLNLDDCVAALADLKRGEALKRPHDEPVLEHLEVPDLDFDDHADNLDFLASLMNDPQKVETPQLLAFEPAPVEPATADEFSARLSLWFGREINTAKMIPWRLIKPHFPFDISHVNTFSKKVYHWPTLLAAAALGSMMPKFVGLSLFDDCGEGIRKPTSFDLSKTPISRLFDPFMAELIEMSGSKEQAVFMFVKFKAKNVHVCPHCNNLHYGSACACETTDKVLKWNDIWLAVVAFDELRKTTLTEWSDLMGLKSNTREYGCDGVLSSSALLHLIFAGPDADPEPRADVKELLGYITSPGSRRYKHPGTEAPCSSFNYYQYLINSLETVGQHTMRKDGTPLRFSDLEDHLKTCLKTGRAEKHKAEKPAKAEKAKKPKAEKAAALPFEPAPWTFDVAMV
jgi:hypothetical protein